MTKAERKEYMRKYNAAYTQKPEVKERRVQNQKRYSKTEKAKQWRKKWGAEWKKKHPNRILINKLRRQYDITWDYFNLILNNQNHCCAICKLKLDINFAYGYAIDHCHKTNKVRGILCRSCNIGLGVFKDSLLNLEAAIKYLKTDIQEEKHSA